MDKESVVRHMESNIRKYISLLIVLMIISDLRGKVLSYLVCIGFPCYWSFQTIQYGRCTQHWINYWTIYSFITLVENAFEVLIELYISEYYYYWKIFICLPLFSDEIPKSILTTSRILPSVAIVSPVIGYLAAIEKQIIKTINEMKRIFNLNDLNKQSVK